jgi:hypothetical protein
MNLEKINRLKNIFKSRQIFFLLLLTMFCSLTEGKMVGSITHDAQLEDYGADGRVIPTYYLSFLALEKQILGNDANFKQSNDMLRRLAKVFFAVNIILVYYIAKPQIGKKKLMAALFAISLLYYFYAIDFYNINLYQSFSIYRNDPTSPFAVWRNVSPEFYLKLKSLVITLY